MVVLFVVILFSVCGIVCGSGGGSSGSGGGGGGAGQECNWIVFSLFCTLDNGHTNKLVSVNGFNFIFDRNVLGTRSLGEILSDRVTFSSIHHIDCLLQPLKGAKCQKR